MCLFGFAVVSTVRFSFGVESFVGGRYFELVQIKGT